MKRITAIIIFILALGPIRGFAGFITEPTQLISWAIQYEQMIDEFNQLVREYDSLNGIRHMADLVNNPALRKYLPAEFENLWNTRYEDSDGILEILTTLPTMNVNQLEEKRLKQLAVNDAMIRKAYKEASRRFDDIQVLLDKVNDAPEAKDIADLQARIEDEAAMVNNEITKIRAMFKAMDKAEQKLRVEKMRRVSRAASNEHEDSPFHGIVLRDVIDR